MDGPLCGRISFLRRNTGTGILVVLLVSSYLVAAFAARNEGSTSAFVFSNRTRRTMSSSLPTRSRSEQTPLKPHLAKTCLQSESFGGFETSSGQQQQRQRQTTKTPASQATPLQTAKRMIKEAIDVGAPAFNHGMIEECAKIYLSAATQIVQGALLPEALHKSLETTIISLGRQTIMNPDAIAWAIRGQFDTIIEYQEPFTPRTNAEVAALGDGTTTATTAAEAALNFEPFTNQIMFLNDPIVVNDNVMGGQSIGLWDDTRGSFKGRVSLVNNGGFASLRWRMKRTQNWSYAKGIYLQGVHHSKPSQHTFRLLLKDKHCENIRGANYKALFCNPNDGGGDDNNNNNQHNSSRTGSTSTTIQIPFTAFDRMEQMGRGLPGMPPLNRGTVTEIGIMAIQPSVVGDFELTFAEWGLYY